MHEVKLIIGGMMIILFFWIAPPQNNPWSQKNQEQPSIKEGGGNDVVLEGLVGGFKPYEEDSRLTRANRLDDD